MTYKERQEHKRLLRLWATGRATMKQMRRCMELDRKYLKGAQAAMRSATVAA